MLYKYVKIVVSFILLFLLFVNFELSATAESVNIKVTIEEGFDGKVTRGKGFPASIKLENSGPAFSGDLLIQYAPSYNTGGALSVHVELPEGSSKTYLVSIPGLVEDSQPGYQNNSTIHLYKGSWKTGNQVTFQGDKTFKPKYIDPIDQVIGVLSENYDRLKELRLISGAQILPLTKEQMPKQGLGLDMLEYLVIDEYAVSELDEEQQLAIIEWINSGGVLVAGAAPDASGSYGLLYPLLPMKLVNENTGTTDFLQSKNNEKPAFKEINLFTGAVETGAKVLQTSADLPATIKKPYGNGTILQTGFSLGDQPLSAWKGYSTWFATFIKEADKSNMTAQHMGQDLYDQLYWEFAETNEFFPASNYSVGQLIIFLLVYLIVLVPVLYFILRKLDKRGHSWWIIPSLAIIMSAIIFGLGAKDRIAEPQLNQMGVYKLKDNQLSGLQTTTLLSNRSGEYSLQVGKEEFQALPYRTNPSTWNPSMGAVLEDKRKVNEITFRNVGYWSSETVYGKAQKETNGKFIVNLSLKNNQLTGSIENRFPYDFEELFIWSGSQKIEFGPLMEGETLKVNQKIKQSFMTGPVMLSNSGMYPNQQTDLEKMKIERLQYAAAIFLNGDSNNQPLLGGITKEEIVDVNLTGKKAKENNLNLILARFAVESDFLGEFSLKNEMFSTRVEVINGLIHEKGMNGIVSEMMMEDGEYDYILQLPEQIRGKKVNYKSLSLQLNGPPLQFSLLNRETGEYLPVNANQNNNFTLNKDDKVEQFFSKEGEILIKLQKNSNGDPYVSLPQITLKGEVTP